MLAEERRIVREESRYWWVLLVSGIAWVLIAWIVLRLNQTSITTVGVLIGVVFIVAAVNEVTVAALVPGGWKGLALPDGVHLLPRRAVGTDRARRDLLRARLRARLDLDHLRRVRDRAGGRLPRPEPLLVGGLITGVLLILLAFWVSGSDRVYALAQRTYLILFWVGFFALFKGIMQIVLAFGVRRAGKEAEAASAMA